MFEIKSLSFYKDWKRIFIWYNDNLLLSLQIADSCWNL
jgi:hypothetical protein